MAMSGLLNTTSIDTESTFSTRFLREGLLSCLLQILIVTDSSNQDKKIRVIFCLKHQKVLAAPYDIDTLTQQCNGTQYSEDIAQAAAAIFFFSTQHFLQLTVVLKSHPWGNFFAEVLSLLRYLRASPVHGRLKGFLYQSLPRYGDLNHPSTIFEETNSCMLPMVPLQSLI